MPTLVLAVSLAAQGFCGDEAFRLMAEGIALARELNLPSAAERFEAAVEDGCGEAEVAAFYLRGLATASVAVPGDPPDEGAAAAMQAAMTDLASRAGGRSGVAEIARLILEAASASIGGAYDAMTVYLGHAVDMAELQLAASQPEAPVVSAFEAAGMMFLRAGRAEAAREQFLRAEVVVGRIPSVIAGLAATAMALEDNSAACREGRELLSWWGDRVDPPWQVEQARAYVLRPECA